jgi:cellulose synthase/poly-beta-1,6-N-acetylglucosamine synthase-like glycosyltransferase
MRGLFQLVFLMSMAFSIYTLVGYPIALALFSRWHHRSIHKAFSPRTVTILLAVRNGGRWLRAKLECLTALDYPPELLQIVLISDGSTDETDLIAQEFADTNRIEFVRIASGGKAVALNAGLDRARGQILFFTDVRQHIEPHTLRHLVSCFADPSVGVVSGELVIRDGRTLEESSVGLYWKYEKWMRKRESQIDSMLGATGCIYAMRRELATPLPAGTLVDDMFLPLSAFFRGYRIILEEKAKAFDDPTALGPEFQRKVRTLAGVYQIMALYPKLLTRRNRMLVSFVSHKLARLLLPYVLVVASVTTFALPEPFRSGFLFLQAGFYLLAVGDPWIREDCAIKTISCPVRGFVVFMAAALCATMVVFPVKHHFWKPTSTN